MYFWWPFTRSRPDGVNVIMIYISFPHWTQVSGSIGMKTAVTPVWTLTDVMPWHTPQIAKIFGSISRRHRSDAKASYRCLIDVDHIAFAIWGMNLEKIWHISKLSIPYCRCKFIPVSAKERVNKVPSDPRSQWQLPVPPTTTKLVSWVLWNDKEIPHYRSLRQSEW